MARNNYGRPSLSVLMTKRYRNVSLPEELYEMIEELVKSNKGGYVSVSEAVKDAVRELLRKYEVLP